ncbi:MAG: hypothetical protein H0Z22_08325 [Thermosipho sp. (in: Bacteria)]|nr:hypothetical protein [Thermosipho sp. (in: thermotogales)]
MKKLLLLILLFSTSFLFAGKLIYIEGDKEFSDGNLLCKIDTIVRFGENYYYLTVKNISQEEIKIYWNKSMIVDNFRRPVPIVPESLVEFLLEKPELITIIKPGETISFVIHPFSHVLSKKAFSGYKFKFTPLNVGKYFNSKISLTYEYNGKILNVYKEFNLKVKTTISIKDVLFVGLFFAILGGILYIGLGG